MKKYIPGIFLCVLLAVLAEGLSSVINFSGVTIAILFGMALRNIKAPAAFFEKGIKFSEKTLLSWAIVFMGVELDFSQFQSLGVSLFFIVVSGIVLTITMGIMIGRLFKIDTDLALLISIGNAVCGSSAIAASQSVINADEDKVGLSIGIINFLGTIGIFLLPAIISIIKIMTEMQGGVLIGNTLQAIAQVSAAGFSLGEKTGQIATVVKMGRILMIIPVVLTLSFVKNKGGEKKSRKAMSVPPYIFGFIFFSILGSLNILPPFMIIFIKHLGLWLLMTAMAAIGMKITLSSVLSEGRDSFFMGLTLFLFQILSSIGYVFLLL